MLHAFSHRALAEKHHNRDGWKVWSTSDLHESIRATPQTRWIWYNDGFIRVQSYMGRSMIYRGRETEQEKR